MSTLTNSKNGKWEGPKPFVYLNLFQLASEFPLTAQSLNPLLCLVILQKETHMKANDSTWTKRHYIGWFRKQHLENSRF